MESGSVRASWKNVHNAQCGQCAGELLGTLINQFIGPIDAKHSLVTVIYVSNKLHRRQDKGSARRSDPIKSRICSAEGAESASSNCGYPMA